MRKILKIELLEPYKILCIFDNGEQRIIDLDEVLKKSNKYTSKVFSNFHKTKIGSNGEIYWDGIGEIKNLNGETIPCEYDICPDFAYINSIPK